MLAEKLLGLTADFHRKVSLRVVSVCFSHVGPVAPMAWGLEEAIRSLSLVIEQWSMEIHLKMWSCLA